jgi:hypothetical protein
MEGGGEGLRAATYFMAFMLALNVRDAFKERSKLREILAGVRWRHAGWALVALIVVFTAAIALANILPKPLQWGWLQLLGANAPATTGAAAGTHVDRGYLHVLRYVMFFMLAFAMPTLVLYEEKVFRHRAPQRSLAVNIGLTILFGLSHMILGIPFHFALAIAAAGGVFLHVYQRSYAASGNLDGALMESSRVHLTYNYILLGVLLLAMAVVDIGRFYFKLKR